MSNSVLIVFMVVSLLSFLVIQVLLGLALRELFRDLKQFKREIHEELAVIMAVIVKVNTAQEHICKILDRMVNAGSG